jgi:tetratricopeptide (TPR) repeat protein
LAKYYLKNDKIEDAEKILMKLSEKNSKDAEILKHLGDLEKQKKNYKKAIEYIKNSISYSSVEIMKEDLKLTLAQLYLICNSNHSIQEAEKILGTIKIDKFPYHCNIYRFYFLRTALFMLTQNIEKLKSTIATVLYVVKDFNVDSVCPVRYPDFRMVLKEKLKPREFDCIFHLERMMLSEASIESFVKKFGESIDLKMVKDINEELQDSGSNIFKRILDENITENEKITEICGSRLAFESLLYKINIEFPNLPDSKQSQTVSFLTQRLEKLPESYKWLVLDFCSKYLIDLRPNLQSLLVNSLLNVLKEKKDSDEFLKETQSFLQTAKTMLDAPLKLKIEKELFKIKNEGEK